MTPHELEERISRLKVWQRGAERAPHKPLLILLALARLARGDTGPMSYTEVDEQLGELLREFGPPRASVHPEYPFWRLQHDGIWQVTASGPMTSRQSANQPTKSELIRQKAYGSFTEPVCRLLRRDPALAFALAQRILDANFPASLHDDLLNAVGLEPPAPVDKARRDPAFRNRVLTAYEQRCSICAFDVRLGSIQVGLDAAHIKWHQAGGPDVVENGLALCVLHHKLFDRGAFTITDRSTVELSERLHGGVGFDSLLLAFHGRPLRSPTNPAHRPSAEFLHWHRKEVFHGPGRYVPVSAPE